ncbi:MAG TPA: hypothetical protein VGI66_17520 [Streptosporangiaceae bacterium]|jgi:hypothetical protein
MPGSNSQSLPWEGTSLCSGTAASRQPCGNFEIEGMGFCFQHVPDDALDEAEEVTGLRRCRHGSGCRSIAVTGTKPARCKNHGANQGSVVHQHAAANVNESEIAEHLSRIMAIGGEQLLNPPMISDPLTELLMLAAEVKVFKNMLTERVSMMNIADWRFTSKSMGEQTRAEIQIYERALDRLGGLLINISKLNIEARLAQIDDQMLTKLERAMVMALESTGLNLAGIDTARQTLRRELYAIEGKVIQGEVA